MIAGSSCVNIKRNNLRSSHDNNFTSSKFLFMLVIVVWIVLDLHYDKTSIRLHLDLD